jgi:hypothetical protein
MRMFFSFGERYNGEAGYPKAEAYSSQFYKQQKNKIIIKKGGKT